MIPTRNAHLRVAAGSDPGRTGKNNEDQFSVSAFQMSDRDDTPVVFALVCDGIGGHRAGEVAARLAVELISEAVARSDASQPGPIMESGLLRANQAILASAEGDDEKKGMGTTAICAWVIGDRLYTASVGNSRLYLLREGALRQLNWDHTWVQEAVDAGALTPELARKHPNANIIRRYLGSRRPLEVDFRLRVKDGESEKHQIANQGLRLLPGDRLILCSDGLNDMVEDAEIQSLGNDANLAKARQSLIERANEQGGKDNITVVILEVPGGTREKKRKQKDRARKLSLGCLITSIVLLAASAAFYYWGLPLLRPSATATPTLEPTIPSTATYTRTPPFTDTPMASATAASTNTPRQPTPTDTLVPFGALPVSPEATITATATETKIP
ncbi:MAG: serine/threonine-protein phosphatase [Chloroflexi bacterium]|nr:serine/threonine-protein phosphatase [Chloroflexota bacterium]